jgi:hypothetical protein
MGEFWDLIVRENDDQANFKNWIRKDGLNLTFEQVSQKARLLGRWYF